jgi:hypothetical protein
MEHIRCSVSICETSVWKKMEKKFEKNVWTKSKTSHFTSKSRKMSSRFEPNTVWFNVERLLSDYRSNDVFFPSKFDLNNHSPSIDRNLDFMVNSISTYRVKLLFCIRAIYAATWPSTVNWREKRNLRNTNSENVGNLNCKHILPNKNSWNVHGKEIIIHFLFASLNATKRIKAT